MIDVEEEEAMEVEVVEDTEEEIEEEVKRITIILE